MLDDASIDVLHAALNGLAARQSAISDDIANVNTPYYRAKSVSFENSLQQAVADGSNPLAVTPTVTESTAAVGLTYSNVDLSAETVSSVKTEMSYDLALRATGDRFTLLQTAAKDS